MAIKKSLTEWGLNLAVAHDLELRPGNEGEVGPTRGFALHVRGLEQSLIFRYDPEGKPRQLIAYLPDVAPALEPLEALIADPENGFLPGPYLPGYMTLRWKPGEREALKQVLVAIIRKTKQIAMPDLGSD